LGPSKLKGDTEYRLLLQHGKIEKFEPTGETKMDGAEAILKKAVLVNLFPKGSEAKLVRNAILNCVSGMCQLLFLP
jgi:hypothetical protein